MEWNGLLYIEYNLYKFMNHKELYIYQLSCPTNSKEKKKKKKVTIWKEGKNSIVALNLLI